MSILPHVLRVTGLALVVSMLVVAGCSIGGGGETGPDSRSGAGTTPTETAADRSPPSRPGVVTAEERSRLLERARSIGTLQSFLVEHRGDLIVNEYLRGMEPGEHTNVKSAAKSILSLLVGIAIDEGHIDGVDQPIGPYFEDYFRANPDSAKERITIRNLLTMRTGLETTSFHNYGEWVASPNWVRYALDQPMVDEPGYDMEYSTGTTHLLSVILTRATGMSTRRYAQTRLFEPLGIQVGGWDRDPQGYYMGGNNMAFTPKGMLRIGRTVLNGGTYEGRRVVPEQWLDRTFQTYTRSNYNPYDYGFLWWKRPVAGHEVRFAWGYGGQYIFIVPQREAVVVVTSRITSEDEGPDYRRDVFDLVGETIRSMESRNPEAARPG